MTGDPRSLELAIDLAAAWRREGMGVSPERLREGVSHAVSVGRDTDADPIRLVLESVVAGIIHQLDRHVGSPAPAGARASGATPESPRLHGLCAALAAGLPADVLSGERRPTLRVAVRALLSRVARGARPATALGQSLAEFDAALAGSGRVGSGRVRAGVSRAPCALATLRHGNRGRFR